MKEKAVAGNAPQMSLKANAKQLRAAAIMAILSVEYPDAKCALNFSSPEELLVATILSAQCTDNMVNRVTPALFRQFPVPEGLAGASLPEIQKIIKPCGYYRQKSKFVRESCRKLLKDFGGRAPRSIEELTTLPGVARKTANVVLSVAFDINQGVAVDTHVARLSRRLGLARSSAPPRIEIELMKAVPQKEWGLLTTLLIAHGRAVCTARKPDCGNCCLNAICPSAFRT